MTRASECREWLRKNPGWHSAQDVADGLGAKDPSVREAIARCLLQASKGLRKPIYRLGRRGTYRYRWPA
jgi:hypothetical protein